jgi:hypothetical protein
MSVIQLGCLQAALLAAATISSSAIAEIPPNAAESPTGEGRALRPQDTAGAAHDWEIPDSALSLDAVAPNITVNVPTEFKIDIDLTIHRADVPSGEQSERLRRAKATARGVHHLHCLDQARRHP